MDDIEEDCKMHSEKFQLPFLKKMTHDILTDGEGTALVKRVNSNHIDISESPFNFNHLRSDNHSNNNTLDHQRGDKSKEINSRPLSQNSNEEELSMR